MMKQLYTYSRGKSLCLPRKGNHGGMLLRSLLGLAVLCCSTAIYADAVDPIAQGNSNADRIAAQAQTNMTQQQQILAQRLQTLSAAMQAQNPDSPIVVQQAPTPVQPVQPAPATPPATTATPPVATTPSATGLKLPSQNNNNNSRNKWDYGF